MTFGRNRFAIVSFIMAGFIAACFSIAEARASTRAPTALVPVRTIYPGEVLSANQVEAVAVTNPNIAAGYASSISEIEGLISKQTLLPGRIIPVSALRMPAAVERGRSVRLVFTLGSLTLTASGSPLTDGAIGDVVRVRNLDSGVIVNGTVMHDGTIQVMAK